MNRQKKIASVLAGVSFVALSVAASPAMSAGTRQGTAAAGTTINSNFSGNWIFSNDGGANGFIYIDGAEVDGDLVVDEDIGDLPGEWNDTGIEIDNGGSITGDLIVNSGVGVGANVYVTDGAGIDASTSVAGIYIHDGGQIEGDLVNNGSVTGYARAEAPDNATAMAFGVGSESDDDSSVFNYGDIDATADATAYDSALAIAGGVGQLDGGTDDETASLYNEGSVTSVANATSLDEQFDYATDQAIALAFGAGQYIDAVTAVAYVTNAAGGEISASAIANAADEYNETLALGAAAGIGQITVGETANGYVHNDGTVSGYAEARAYSGEDDATAIAVSLGSLQAATAYGSATVDLVNDNSISANARAIASGLGANDTGVAIAAAIGNAQLAMSSNGDAAASAVNTGDISASAYASANGYTAIANADALGNVQAAMGNSADAYFDNSGDILATATAAAYGFQAASYGVAGGLFQAAIAYEESATATLKNAGTIDVESNAYANGGLAVAEAWGLGVAQIAVTYGTGDATAALTNTSMDSIDVHANAYATGAVAFADAYDFGAAQIAVAGMGGTASALANNSGRIDAYASAIAHGSTAATAEADAAGLNQLALGVESDVYLENTGVIEAHANARADAGGKGGNAQAGAQAIGAQQAALGLVADATIINSNLISAVASATATGYGTNGDALAYATAAGAVQFADGDVLAKSVTRNTGTISAYANSFAYATDDASAYASAVGLEQFAEGAQANAITYNEGTIIADAAATATAGDTAYAYANATGVEQGVDAVAGTASLQNSASITATAFAKAVSTNDDATATATAAGVRQAALGAAIDATVSNSNSIAAAATAYATESKGWDAIASANATGIDQDLLGSVVSGSVINTSSISAVASGYAYSTDEDAEADGYAYGVSQTFGGSVGELDFYNAGSVTATANASALAYDDADASAWAMGLDQEGSGLNVTLTATNLGSISAVANAYAYSTTNDADASAGATAAWQEANAAVGTIDFYNDGSLSAVANATVTGNDNVLAEGYAWGLDQHVNANVGTITATNLGTISAEANALAYSTDNDADATATATGVHQYMSSNVATADFYNAGTISALANADAYGWDDVSATADAFGLRQEAYASSITLTATNVGTISAAANGYAYSTNEDADADADATAADQFLQGAVVSGAFDNQGSLSAVAYATATAWMDGEADATATGLDQFARDGISATLTASNSGTIYASAHAKALSIEEDSDNWADASAEATGVSQEAYNFSATASLDFYNEGSILAVANASATAWGDADGDAEATGLYQNANYGGAGTVAAINHGDISAFANGHAYSTDNDAQADAEADGVDQQAYSYSAGTASLSLINDGNITADALAIASAVYGSADASASVEGVEQDAYGATASADLTNQGDITAVANADAFSLFDNADADASATGVDQYVMYGTVSTDLYNEGNISAGAVAYATGQEEVDAYAFAQGVDQEGFGYLATLDLTNHGNITAVAAAHASSTTSDASATATATGVEQYAGYGSGSTAYLDLVNTGDIAAAARAHADAYSSADADAYGYGAYQTAYADVATLTAMNSGSISAVADADAHSVYSSASASATSVGFGQYATPVIGSADLYNEGDITAASYADAGAPDYAEAYASSTGVGQYIGFVGKDSGAPFDGPSEAPSPEPAAIGNLAITNHGEISGFAAANATSTGSDAWAEVFVNGVYQGNFALEGNVMLDNHGDILGTAIANADGDVNDIAIAAAFGHNVEVGGPYGWVSTPTIDVSNDDGALISAYADAEANDQAYAVAIGGSYAGEATLNGTIVNAGIIQAAAFAEVSAYGTAVASAFGVVELSTGANNTTLTNTGTIRAYAEGPNAYATGIAIASDYYRNPTQTLDATGPSQVAISSGFDPDPVTGLATVNNDGGVIEARYSTDGGETVHRGNAINTRGFILSDGELFGAAPNPVQFNFTGGVAGSDGKAYVIANDRVSTEVQAALAGYSSWGYVNGDIMLTYDDNALVKDGVTIFDGQFNSDGQNVGDLTIDTDGKLVLVQPDLEGDAQAGGYVDDFTVGSTGSLVYELTTSDAPGDYASIDANTASLDGRIVAVYNAGLYGNNMYYDNVIDADTRTGEFTDVEDNSLLLVTQAVYDDENNVDLAVKRTAFNKVDGLTKNQKAVGGGIEKVYDQVKLNTDFGQLVASLFTLGDGDYQDFLDQLSGAEYANHLASVLWSTRAIDRIITDRMECTPDSAYQRAADNSSVRVDGSTVTPTADVITSTGCFRPGEANIWMSGTGQWNELSGDRNAPGFDETQYGIFFGADYAFTETLFAGIAGGYFDSQGDFDKWGGRSGSTIDYDGLQLAAYGGYDNATYYLRGIVAYGNYDGDSHRQIKFPGAAEIDPSGSPSSDTWSFYGETGYRFGVMTAGQITPFLGLSLASANLDGFTEKDPQGTGAALKIHDSDASSVATVLGARFTGDWAMASGVFSPVLSVAWMHEFGDTAQEVNMSFAGAPKGANFKVVGSEVARDSAVVDAGAKFMVSDSFDLGLFYNGQFNADYTSNGVTATLGYRF